jgi:hypothetical protein
MNAMPKDKPSAEMLLSSPSTGSSNPSSSLPALWSYMLPALYRILRSIDNDAKKTHTLLIALDYYTVDIHTHCYNYLSSQSTSAAGLNQSQLTRMKELYDKLDEHVAHAVHELFKCAPRPDSAILIWYVLACLKCFSAGARSISRLLNYLNEHYITPAVNDGRGWFDDDDRADVVATIGMGYLVEGKDRRKQELKKWGYKEGGPKELLAQAEAQAEATSAIDCMVPLSSLLLRRLWTEFIEPLLQRPGVTGEGQNQLATTGTQIESRLACAVNQMQKGEDEDRRLLAELAVALKTVGIRANQPLRKRLDKLMRTTICQ